jgi:hypothetical protein
MSKDPYLQLLRARVNIDVNWPVSIGRILGDRVWPDLGDPRGALPFGRFYSKPTSQ